jgi:formimidoylglutamase
MLEEFLEPSEITIEKKSKDPNEIKLSDIISSGINKNADIGIVGIPFDLGVEFSNGRAGARKAPDKIREELNKYGTAFNIDYLTDISDLKVSDFGNIIVNSNDPIETYNRIKTVINEMVRHKIIPLVLGGGHDITYPCVEGFSKNFKKIGGVNVDVHFDVREQIGKNVSSGMVFRKILEDIDGHPLKGKNFVEIGADGNVNARKYWEYLKNKNVTVYPIKFIRDSIKGTDNIEHFMENVFNIAGMETNALFVSLDIDSIISEAAPGCSFINPNGFTTDEISRIAHAIGFNKKVRYFDIVETNPDFDVDNRTTRLCARLICCFLTGYKQRMEKQD